MLRLDLAKRFGIILRIINWLIPALIFIMTWLTKVDTSHAFWQANPLLPIILTAVNYNDQIYGWSIPIAAGLAAGINVFRRKLGHRVTWEGIQGVLEKQRDYLFPEDNEEPIYHNMITLFKYVNFYWLHPFNPGWLRPVARCHDFRRSGIPSFRAPKNNPSKGLGIGWEAFSRGHNVIRLGLPDLNQEEPTEAEYEVYAERVSVTVEWLNARKQKGKDFPQALSAGPVESLGKTWGVIVIDGRRPQGFSKQKLYRRHYKDLLGVLSKLLRFA